MRGKCFTLIELIIVMTILCILTMMAISSYRKVVLSNYDKEAREMLLTIKEAERMFRLKYGVYAACSNTSQCNQILWLDLPAGNSSYWEYNVSATSDNFCSQATHNKRSWYINQSMEEARLGVCPQ